MNPHSLSEDRVTLRERFRAATREAILDAAAGLLTSERASHVRMEDIAAGAGIAVGTLYNYFQDRAALVRALLETRTRTLLEMLDAAATPGRGAERAGPAAFTAELDRFVSAVARHLDANRFLLNVLQEEEQQRGIDARAASRRRTVLGELLLRAERMMERGIRQRALRKADPALYAAMLIGMVRGLAMSALTRGDDFASGWSADVVRMFMHGAAR